MRLHGRNLVHIERLGLRHAQGTRCKRRADLCDEQDHEFALCEPCLLAWDIQHSGLAHEWSPSEARRTWQLWYGTLPVNEEDAAKDRRTKREERKRAERYLRALTKALAEAESRRWQAHGAVS